MISFLFFTNADPHTLKMFSDRLLQPEVSQENVCQGCLLILQWPEGCCDGSNPLLPLSEREDALASSRSP